MPREEALLKRAVMGDVNVCPGKNRLTAIINHERSPVLLTEEEQFTTWLTGTPDEAFSLIKASDLERMQIVQSGFEKKDLQQAA